MNQIDRIFRDKLEKHHKEVPNGAWNRLEKKMVKKDNKMLWLKAAASLLIFASASYLIWPDSETIDTPLRSAQNTIEKQPAVQKNNKPANKNNEEQGKTDQQPLIKKPKVIKKTTKQKALQQQTEILIAKQNDVAASLQDSAGNTTRPDRQPGFENTQNDKVLVQAGSETSVAEISSTNTLIISADEVNRKYLNLPEQNATTQTKKASGIRKLLTRAKSLKENQDPLGELREKKNEILALNFTTEKRRQN